ncbi:MAG: efflux RND transporter periplasmic adaptor subunit [Porticoccaceae bacterium]|nr:efflux RND transporter periplasmic adaptor subunit [Porticoccaceae bacterium]
MQRNFLFALVVLLAFMAVGVQARNVTCLGRIEPFNGVYKPAGPSAVSVVSELRVLEGSKVKIGDVLATLDGYALAKAELDRAKADLDYAQLVMGRENKLLSATSQSRRDEANYNVNVSRAGLAAARARLELTLVRAPVGGEVLLIHTREGERITEMGLLELGQTEKMYVVAEVYETDVGMIAVGQNVTITSPALSKVMSGKVERIGKIIGKIDSLALDPVTRTDSRVVEVFVLLDDPQAVANLTNLQVQVEIGD